MRFSSGVGTAICLLLISGCTMFEQPDVTSENLIPFSCDDGDSEVCVVDLGSSEVIQLTHNESSDFGTAINSINQIVYACNDGDWEICAINADGSEQRQLTHNETSDQAPDINDAGLITYSCVEPDSPPQICTLNIDGSGAQVLDVSPYNDPIAGSPDVNNSGQIVFICSEQSPMPDLCAMRADGSDLHTLISDDTEDVAPKITSSGLIVFGCGAPPEESVCLINFDGSGMRNLTDTTGYRSQMPFMNDRGQIAFGCRQDGARAYELCVIQVDGSEFSQLTSKLESPYDLLELTDNGQIVYRCDLENRNRICAIDFDGTNEHEIGEP